MTTPMSSPLDGNGVALEPCPFCGGSAILICERTCDRQSPHNPADRAYPRAICKCGVEVPGENWSGKRTAVAAWNRRASPAPSHTAVEPVAELVERLRDIVTEFDNEVADMMSNDGAERADLWVDVDVPIGIVRQADSALTAQAAALAKAESELEQVRATYENLEASEIVNGYKNRAEAAESEAATLKARVAELEAGLEPFARMFDEWMRDYPDGGEKEEPPAGKHAWGFNGTDLLWGDFIRARRLTHQEKNNG